MINLLYFLFLQQKIKIAPITAIVVQAGQRSNGASAVIPVMMVKTSAVAMPTYSPDPKAATASAEAVKNAEIKKNQPKTRPTNIGKSLDWKTNRQP